MKSPGSYSRRQFFGGVLAATVSGIALPVLAAENKLAFITAGKEFHFDTGILRGTLRAGGQSKGLIPAFDCVTGRALTKSLGLFSHYRLLDDQTRYGKAGWDWASEAKLLDGGGVEVRWLADNEHPFDMMAIYRWSAPNTLDLTTCVTARKELKCFEVFLASYFDGFPATTVYAKNPAAEGKPAFIGANKTDGVWHMFPRDEEAVKMIKDGRWKRPPNPVEWTIRPMMAAPLAVRRDTARGLAAVLMARVQDCFAIATPQDNEGHRSVYLSLFGRDFKSGESADTKSRLIIGRDITDEKAIAFYEAFQK
ncbi:MAG: hypothetical protein PHR77_00320 [Kiritimatiellae bacterium]|nr:hypothetical protein [Kiritimatiellia bacterium]MDD5519825.1 hypothetical protein [Kiritimatiellia bacterium]